MTTFSHFNSKTNRLSCQSSSTLNFMQSRCQRVKLIRTVTMKSGKPHHGSEKVTEVEMSGRITNLEIYSTRPDMPTIFIVQTNCARWNLLREKNSLAQHSAQTFWGVGGMKLVNH